MNEKGYSLVLTIFVMFLFSMLSVYLMSYTLGGTKRNHINESNIQATSLANKGVEYITAQINADLEHGLTNNGLPRSDFINLLNNTLNKYKTKLNSINSTGSTGDYNVYISDIQDSVDSNGNPNPLRKRVTFVSTGIADGNQKQVTTVIEIGAQSVLDTLKYAVGANKCTGTNCNHFNGEGNMFLHGGVTIQGDFKVDGNLITTDRGYAYLNGQKWIDSQYPSILPAQGETDAHLVLSDNSHIYTFSNTPDYYTHISTTTFGSTYTDRTKNINSAFYTNNAPIIVKRQVPLDDISIDDKKNVFYYPPTSAVQLNGGSTNGNNTIYNNDLNYPNQKVYASYQTCNKVWVWKLWPISGYFVDNCTSNYDGTYTFSGNNTFGNFATQGSLQIISSPSNFKITTFTNGAYIEKDLTIGNGSNSYDINSYDKIQIDGPIFVNGNVTIKGANGQFNSIMYVMGNVTIENSQLNGLGDNGSLIIFAKGNINIRNNSVNQDTPSNIKGFFYSEQALEMFGVGSNIRIVGGISARRIVLNAIRGKASNTNFPGAQKITSSDYFEGKANQIGKNSRLQIIYDPNIMNTYADIKSREPVITKIDPPQLISRNN
jgi:hypothetical protein